MAPTIQPAVATAPSWPRRIPRVASRPVSRHHKPRIQWAAALLVFASLLSAVAATASSITAPPTPTEVLLVDTRTPVMDGGHWTMLSEEEAHEYELRKRAPAVASGSVTTTVRVAVSSVTDRTKTTTVAASPLPSPFDSSLASNFSTTGNCPAFINSFLTNSTFKQCYPFSELLQGSRSFFDAEKSLVSITQVLDASCAANVTFCTDYLNGLATNLTDPANCGEDYQLGNSIVVQAYLGMIAYQSLYTTTCLKDPDTSTYCFANAVTNLTTPSNVYFYYLPLNISLPGSSIPSCSWCLQQTMAVFQSASANRKLPIANTYKSAAQQVNTICGPNFVNDTLPVAVVSGAGLSLGRGPPPAEWMLVPLLLAAAMHLLL